MFKKANKYPRLKEVKNYRKHSERLAKIRSSRRSISVQEVGEISLKELNKDNVLIFATKRLLGLLLSILALFASLLGILFNVLSVLHEIIFELVLLNIAFVLV